MHSFKELVSKFEEQFIGGLPFAEQPNNLYDPCRYLLQLGGKRVRPVLVLMANELFAELSEDAWHAANAIELLHNFTLIHDDIMDKAPLRRGNPTIHAKYGLTAGILCGDVMCIHAYDELAKVQTALPEVLRLFNRTAIEICDGQQMDMDFEERNDVHIDEYIKMIKLKTSVLLACSLKIGALINGADADNADKLYDFGLNVGLAFQLQDDYLDAFGDTQKLGKQNGGDILANKKTYLLLTALENADEHQKGQIDTLLATASTDKVSNMLAQYEATGANTACRDAVAHYSEKAFECLDSISVANERKEHLKALASYLLQRDN